MAVAGQPYFIFTVLIYSIDGYFHVMRTKEDHLRDFWMRETGTGQQVARLLDSYTMVIFM
jgi:very-short-patch-repair endonuclease